MAVGFDQWFQSPTDRGFLAESFPGYFGLVGNTLLQVAGRQEMVRLKVPQAAQCTNIVINVAAAGSTLTAGQNFAALYTGAGILVAQSVDQTTNWGGTGNKSAQLNGGPYYLHAGDYYATFWYNGTTAPTLARGVSITGGGPINGTTAAPNFIYAFNAGGYTTAAPASLGTQTVGGITWWVALS